ncbi:hypothetical protein [Fulvimarina manganoxydans]|nr:hypothetical protein [Fulvimarina manganoxydans]
MAQPVGNPYNLPDPIDFDPHEPIERRKVNVRLDPLSWPENTDVSLYHEEQTLWFEALETLRDFDELAAETAQNTLLSAEGKTAANAKFARDVLTGLQRRLDALTEKHVKHNGPVLEKHVKEFMGRHAEAPTEPNDIAVCAEIRAWLRGMPETQRTLKVRELAMKGEKAAIQAVLHAPGFLTGVDLNFIRELQIDLWSQAEPRRSAVWKHTNDVSRMTRRALDGVIRFIGNETGIIREIRPIDEAEAA